MKTVVLGLFDRLEDAEGVLEQLSGAPLDLDAVQILHRDTVVQRRLSEQAGIEPRRSLRTGLVFGGLLGAAIGFAAGWGGAGSEPLLESLGPLLGLAGGSLLGSLVGALGGVVSESSPIPNRHAEVSLEALRQGATMISVQTASLPTARAIGELFRAGGSRLLDEPSEAEGAAALRSDARLQEQEAPSATPGSEDREGADLPEAHSPFAPPWRRASDGGEDTTESRPSSDLADGLPPAVSEARVQDEPSGTEPHPDSQVGIRHGQTVTTVDRSSREVHPRDLPASSPSPDRSEARSERGEPKVATRTDDPSVAEASKPIAGGPELAALALPSRVLTALRKAGLEDQASLREALRRPAGLESIPGIGPASRQEIERVLGDSASPSPSSVGRSESRSDLGPDPRPAPRSQPSAPAHESAEARDPRLEPVARAAEDLLRELFGQTDG